VKRGEAHGFIVGLSIGVPLMLVGVVGMLQHLQSTPPSSFLRFFIGGDLLHDLIVAPLACAVGLSVVRHAPARTRAPLRAALFASAILVAITWPALRGYGRARTPDNHSVQPLNYATAIATALAVVWAGAACWCAVSVLLDRRRHPSPRRPPA
jgi:hypothetical protein